DGRQSQKIPRSTEGDCMNTLKSIFAILILIVLTPVYASEDDNPLRIENLTSISSIVNPATLELAKSVNAVHLHKERCIRSRNKLYN
ncbi:MAG: hypothetical protein ACNA7I_05100, partial [Candidatus Methanoperedens sp.]